MKSKHTYIEFEDTLLWNKVEKAIDDLIENQDLELTTRKEYVIGYICKYLNDGESFNLQNGEVVLRPKIE